LFKRELTLDNPIKLNYYYIMTDTYYESAEDIKLSQDEAFNVLAQHGCQEIDQFLQDMGDKQEYDAQKVLQWLGY
jgi:hypothetical protein